MVTSNADYCRKGSESPETSRRSASSVGSKDSGDTPTDIGTTIRRKLARSATLRHPGSSSSSSATNGSATGSQNTSAVAPGVKGAEMSVCRDCKAMIDSIIKSSRCASGSTGAHALELTLGSRDSSATSSPGASSFGDGQSPSPSGVESARAALRHFRLELKPVYKT